MFNLTDPKCEFPQKSDNLKKHKNSSETSPKWQNVLNVWCSDLSTRLAMLGSQGCE